MTKEELNKEIIDILDNVMYWETCPENYKARIEAIIKQLTLTDVVKSLPQDNYCQICNLPTDGEKCFSKRCPI
jgi:hypothetical protein